LPVERQNGRSNNNTILKVLVSFKKVFDLKEKKKEEKSKRRRRGRRRKKERCRKSKKQSFEEKPA
jgi:hypothetical protein